MSDDDLGEFADELERQQKIQEEIDAEKSEPRFLLGAIAGFLLGVLGTVMFAGALSACGVIA